VVDRAQRSIRRRGESQVHVAVGDRAAQLLT
jgi:hypothetical protein